MNFLFVTEIILKVLKIEIALDKLLFKYKANMDEVLKFINKIIFPDTVSNQTAQNFPPKAGAENSMNNSQRSSWLVR